MNQSSLSLDRGLFRSARSRTLALHGWVGLGLLAVFWPLNWLLSGSRTYWCYFPLWWGLALTIDAMGLRSLGTSLLTRDWRKYVGLSIISIPAWWMFEVLNNIFVQDWYFSGGHLFTDFPAGALGTIALSAVMPVMFGSAELIAGLDAIQRIKPGVPVSLSGLNSVLVFGAGLILLSFVIVFPRYCYAFVWLAMFLMIESINYWRGDSSLARRVAQGDWRPVICLALGGLVAGFFSELWNWQSNPKWFYDVPWFNVWHIFELPALGYVVFLSVGLELHAVYRLVMGLVGFQNQRYVYPISE